MKVAQLCPTLCDPVDYTVHGILQARVLEWGAIPSRSLLHGIFPTQVSYIVGGFFTAELLGKHRLYLYVDMNKEKVMERYTPGFIREMVVQGCGQKLNIIQYIYAMY